MSAMVKDLEPGAKFRVVGLDEDWELIHVGTGSALVRKATRESRTFETATGERVTFSAPPKSFTISLRTNVKSLGL